MVRKVRKLGDRCYRMSPKLGFSVCLFFMIAELRVLEKIPSWRSVPVITSYCGLDNIHMASLVMSTFITWLRRCFLGEVILNLLSFSLPVLAFGSKSLSLANSGGQGVSFTTCRRNIYIYYWEFFCEKDLPVLSSFIYSILRLYPRGLIYLFYTLDYNPVLDYFIMQMVPSLATEPHSGWFLRPFGMPYPFVFGALPYLQVY